MAKRKNSKGLSEAKRRIEQAAAVSALDLDLISLGITELPETISQLKQLQELDLSGNQISSVPESLGQLTALELLDLSDNQLTFLPASLRKLSQLKKFFRI